MSVEDLTTLGMFMSDGQKVNKETKQTMEPSLTEAGGDLDMGLKGDGQTKKPLYSAPWNDHSSVPLFMRDGRNCDQGNAQDEKDASEE